MKPIETPDGQFVDGTRRVPGTPVPAWWLNQQQAEPLNVIKAAGLEPDKDDDTQLLKAINMLAEAASQVSSIEALRRYDGSGYVNVNGYYDNTPGNGGGVFVADEVNKSQADNGGTWIVSDNGTRWRRVYSGGLSLRDFGYDPGRSNEATAFNAADAAALDVVMDCLGLTIDVGGRYPQGNKYTNGKFVVNGRTVDVQYQLPRTGIGRFVSGGGAAESLESGEWVGADLVAIGEGAMGNMRRCVSGVAIGGRAQGGGLKSRDNIAIGADSLYSVSAATEWYDQSQMAGTRNVGIGGNALRGVSSGYSNVGIGRNTGQGLGTGFSNVAIGAAAMAGFAPVGLSGDIEVFWPSPTSRTVAIGESVLQMYQGTAAQTAVGGRAAANTKVAEKVTAIGAGALELLEQNRAPNGGDIIWSGTQAGNYVQAGREITLNVGDVHGAQSGYWVGIRLTSGAAATLQNDIVPVEVISVSGGSLTVRSPKELSASGEAELKFVYSKVSVAAKNEELTAVGANALKNAVSAAYATVVGADAVLSAGNHQKIVAVGASAMRKGNHTSSVAVGYWCAPIVDSEQSVFIGDSSAYRNIRGDVLSGKITNSIAIGYGARLGGSNEIQLGMFNQTLYAPSAVNIRSDARDKADIAPLDMGLDFICKLKPVCGVYDRRDAYTDDLFTDLPPEERSEKLREWWANPVKDGSHKESRRQHWFIAQDVADLEKEYGRLPMVNCREDTYTIEYEMFVPVMVKAMQEMAEQIELLTKQIEELQK